MIDKNITPEFANFVKRCMGKEPASRPATMKDAQMELKTMRIFYTPPTPPALDEQQREECGM